MPYIGRFAPTPSGPLHFGSLVTALASWLDARYHGGRWLLRIDDLDPPRQQPGAADTILFQLEAFGLHWDGEVHYQSRRYDAYHAAVQRLLDQGQAFYCSLSRQQLAELGNIHPGPVLARPPGPDQAIRLSVPDAPRHFEDRVQGRVSGNLQEQGGAFVIRRRDGLFAYQLACALDDTDQGITDVVRGCDLLASTLRQRHVLECLQAMPPAYAHLPVVMAADGGKMSKSAGASMLDSEHPGPGLFAALASVGLTPGAELRRAPVDEQLAWARRHWHPGLLPRGLRLPPPAL